MVLEVILILNGFDGVQIKEIFKVYAHLTYLK
jgi:hypothetical protein